MPLKLTKAEPSVEERIAALPEPDLTDPDNPEWTEEDFARAKGPESLPPEVLANFPNTLKRMGRPPLARPKQQIALRVDADVLDAFKSAGPGWQTRMNDALREAMPKAE